MSDRPHRVRLPRGSVSVGVVLALSAVLFSLSARSASGSADNRSPAVATDASSSTAAA